MTNVDQFESVFRSAAKATFAYEAVDISSVLVITDFEAGYDASLWESNVRSFLAVLGSDVRFEFVHGDDFQSVGDLLDIVERHRPGLICTYRNLQTQGWKWPFTLGDHLEVLTQATTTPVLVLPHPRAEHNTKHELDETSVVMAITDHLTADSRLVNFAALFTVEGGTLVLGHIEDDAVFERYMDAISRVPTIDTDNARDTIKEQLLKLPHDFVTRCRQGLEQAKVAIEVEELVTMGHLLRSYHDLVAARDVDLVVFHTKDEDQMAMHGLAYPLAVDLRDVPILML